MTKKEEAAQEVREAEERLREILGRATTERQWSHQAQDYVRIPRVVGILRWVNRDGDSRVIDLYVVDAVSSELVHIGQRAALVLGWRYHAKHDGIVVHGTGMNMLFHLTSSLGRALKLPAPDGEDSAYSLAHRWL